VDSVDRALHRDDFPVAVAESPDKEFNFVNVTAALLGIILYFAACAKV
jgi:hypothetical protein